MVLKHVPADYTSRNSLGEVGVCCAVRGTAGLREGYWIAFGRCDRLSYYNRQSENIAL